MQKKQLVAKIRELNIEDLLHQLSMAAYKPDVAKRLQICFRLSLEAILLDTLTNEMKGKET